MHEARVRFFAVHFVSLSSGLIYFVSITAVGHIVDVVYCWWIFVIAAKQTCDRITLTCALDPRSNSTYSIVISALPLKIIRSGCRRLGR